MSKGDAHILERLTKLSEQRKTDGLWRTLSPPSEYAIDLSTNSYLSLESNSEIHAACGGLLDGKWSGNLASRILGNRSDLFEKLEAELADWERTERALVFTSGYAANVGILQALCTRETEVFCDRLNHASIVDGIRLSRARLSRYAHCDMGDLQRRLVRSRSKEKVIVTETVFSMDGDMAPLAAICDLAEEHNCLIVVDEAHATGILGQRASGAVEQCGCSDGVQVRVGTLSKAVAGLGGYFAGSRLICDYLINQARSLIYSTGLPASVLAWDLAAVRHIRRNPELGKELLRLAERFRQGIQRLGFATGPSTTAIVPCLLGDRGKARELSQFLAGRGVKVPAIRPPTVPVGTERLRFSLHLGFTHDNQERVLDGLRDWASSHA